MRYIENEPTTWLYPGYTLVCTSLLFIITHNNYTTTKNNYTTTTTTRNYFSFSETAEDDGEEFLAMA